MADMCPCPMTQRAMRALAPINILSCCSSEEPFGDRALMGVRGPRGHRIWPSFGEGDNFSIQCQGLVFFTHEGR